MKTEEIVDAARNAGFSSSEITHRLAAFKRLIQYSTSAEREKCTGTQEFVTLPREVAEQAQMWIPLLAEMAGLDTETTTAEFSEFADGRPASEFTIANVITALRAALKQPQANQPAMTQIAQRKLDDLVAGGYTISGYSVYHEQKHQHGFVTGAGLVGWWKPEGVEYPQAQGEQEPPFWYRPRSDGMYEGPLHKSQIERVRKESGGWVPLYTHPQPQHTKRKPLSEDEILDIWEKKYMSWIGGGQFVHIFQLAEAAHNIK